MNSSRGVQIVLWLNYSFVEIGFGVITTTEFGKGDFLLEYVGERIPKDEADRRENLRINSNFLFGFVFNGKETW